MSAHPLENVPSHTLTLSPIRPEELAEVAHILDQPRLARRQLVSGLEELHPVDWSDRQKTFVVRTDGLQAEEELLGVVDLVRDEEDPDSWELSVTLDHRVRPGDGSRCAAAATFYAFEVLGAEGVWFWARREQAAVRRFAERFGFIKLHQLRLPRGELADVYETDRKGWNKHCAAGLERWLSSSRVVLTDGSRSWEGWRGEIKPLK